MTFLSEILDKIWLTYDIILIIKRDEPYEFSFNIVSMMFRFIMFLINNLPLEV